MEQQVPNKKRDGSGSESVHGNYNQIKPLEMNNPAANSGKLTRKGIKLKFLF